MSNNQLYFNEHIKMQCKNMLLDHSFKPKRLTDDEEKQFITFLQNRLKAIRYQNCTQSEVEKIPIYKEQTKLIKEELKILTKDQQEEIKRSIEKLEEIKNKLKEIKNKLVKIDYKNIDQELKSQISLLISFYKEEIEVSIGKRYYSPIYDEKGTANAISQIYHAMETTRGLECVKYFRCDAGVKFSTYLLGRPLNQEFSNFLKTELGYTNDDLKVLPFYLRNIREIDKFTKELPEKSFRKVYEFILTNRIKTIDDFLTIFDGVDEDFKIGIEILNILRMDESLRGKDSYKYSYDQFKKGNPTLNYDIHSFGSIIRKFRGETAIAIERAPEEDAISHGTIIPEDILHDPSSNIEKKITISNLSKNQDNRIGLPIIEEMLNTILEKQDEE